MLLAAPPPPAPARTACPSRGTSSSRSSSARALAAAAPDAGRACRGRGGSGRRGGAFRGTWRASGPSGSPPPRSRDRAPSDRPRPRRAGGARGPGRRADRRAVERATAEPSRIVGPAEEQVAAAERLVRPYGVAGDVPRREVLHELLAFPESAQALVLFAELPQDPGAGGDRPWQREHGIGRPERGDAVIDPEARPRPVSLDEKEQTGGPVGHADGVRALRRLGELNPLEGVPGALVEPARARRGSSRERRDRTRTSGRIVRSDSATHSAGSAARLSVASSTTRS